MIYNCLKVFHILGAALFVTSFSYCLLVWRRNEGYATVLNSIQTHTWAVLIPVAIFQLATGFTMMSLKHNGLSEWWVKGTVVGFIVMMCSWIGFVYSFVASFEKAHRGTPYYLQLFLLIVCTLALLSMVFLMANKL